MIYTIMNKINVVCTFLFQMIYSPLVLFSPFWSLTVISILTGIFMLWIFSKTSNQQAIKLIKDKIRANLIAVRLYKEDLWIFILLQGRILRDTLIYMRYSLTPLIIMIIPIFLIIVQLHLHYSVRSLFPGEDALVKVKVNNTDLLNDMTHIVMQKSDAFNIETSAVRITAENEMDWRISGKIVGRHMIHFRVGENDITKELCIGIDKGGISNIRTERNIYQMILYPGESPLDNSTGIQSIEITYPPMIITIFGWKVNWLVHFLLISIIFGYALKGPLGVQV